MANNKITIHRDAKNSQFVDKATVERRPATTTTERRNVVAKPEGRSR